jgi:hypothetical protein
VPALAFAFAEKEGGWEMRYRSISDLVRASGLIRGGAKFTTHPMTWARLVNRVYPSLEFL